MFIIFLTKQPFHFFERILVGKINIDDVTNALPGKNTILTEQSSTSF